MQANARTVLVRSNRTAQLRIDPALIPLKGFAAENKKFRD